MKNSVVFFLFLFLVNVCYSQVPIFANNDELDLTPSLVYFEEPEKQLTRSEVLQHLEAGDFIQSEGKDALNFGSHHQAVWVYVKLKSKHEVEKILHFTCAHIYYLDFHEKDGVSDWYTHTLTGRKRKYETRDDLKPKDFAWEIFFDKNEEKEILLRIATRAPMIIPLSIKSVQGYAVERADTYFLYGLYFGVLTIMLLYNLMIYFSLRENVYLYYALSILCTIIVFTSSNGFTDKYVLTESWEVTYFLTGIFMCLMIIPISLFAITFLELKKYSKWSYYYLSFFIAISIPSAIYVKVFEDFKYSSFLIAVFSFSLLAIGLITMYKKNPYAKFYVLAWALYIAGGLLVTLRNLGYLPSNIYTDHGAEVGSAVEVCLLAFALAYKMKTIRKQNQNLQAEKLVLIESQRESLERLVEERTLRLRATVKELNQKQVELTEQNTKVTDSINYAQRIQEAILPKENLLKANFKDYTQLYLPKDIVSGDFIFYLEHQNLKYFSVVDCTGHGVPGAIIGMLGYNILYEIIKVHHLKDTDEILCQLDAKIQERLRQNESAINDGMDMSLLVIDEKNKEVTFSGARNPILIQKIDGTHELIKGCKRSIGDEDTGHCPFKKTVLDYKEIKWIYTYSDGFQDQFSEKTNTKYFSKRLRELLLANTALEGELQAKELFSEFFKWKGKEPQIDDVTVTGIRLN